MLGTALIEDLNRLACAEEQERYAAEPERARESLMRLRWVDTTELERYRREEWLARGEVDMIERLLRFASDRLGRIPDDADALAFTRADPGWQAVRERALELVVALDAFIDIGVAGWGHQYAPRGGPAA